MTVLILSVGVNVYKTARSYANETMSSGDECLSEASVRLMDKYNGKTVNPGELKRWLFDLSDYDPYTFVECAGTGIRLGIEEYLTLIDQSRITSLLKSNTRKLGYSDAYKSFLDGLAVNAPNPQYLDPAKQYRVSVSEDTGGAFIITIDEV